MAETDFPMSRSGEERRKAPPTIARTDNCDTHEERMDQIDKDINTGKGWFKAMAATSSIVILGMGFIASNINSKLNNIEAMLTNDKSDIRLLNEQMLNTRSDVREIQDRHKFQDQERLRIGNPR
jgi:hypothetical protein